MKSYYYGLILMKIIALIGIVYNTKPFYYFFNKIKST